MAGRPITNISSKGFRRRDLQKLYRADGDGKHTCGCGSEKSAYARQCRRCANVFRRTNADPSKEAFRTYMAERRARTLAQMTAAQEQTRLAMLRLRSTQRKSCRNRECLYSGYDHAHCECGLAVAPTEQACPMCIAEQRRLEHKTWPKEEAA